LDKGNIEEDVYEPEGDTSDTNEDVRFSSIQFGVVRCSHTTIRDENWRRSNVFHTYIIHEGKNYKLMRDETSCANTIVKMALEKIDLKTEPHPHPYNVN